MEGMVDPAQTGYCGHWAVISPAEGAEQSRLIAASAQPIPGSQALNKGPQPWQDPSLHTQPRLCFQSTKAALEQFTEDSLRKANWFGTISPRKHTHKKINTLYKGQQRYNLNMHPATNHIYRETGLYKQNRTIYYITILGEFLEEITADEQNQTEGGGLLLLEVIWFEMAHNTPPFSSTHISYTSSCTQLFPQLWTPFLYRGRFLLMFWYCTTVNMVLITRNNLQRLISIIHGHNLIVGIQVVQ